MLFLFLLIVEGRSPPPRFVAFARPLDFDHVRAEVAQNHGAYWASKDSTKIKDF